MVLLFFIVFQNVSVLNEFCFEAELTPESRKLDQLTFKMCISFGPS